MNRKLMTVWTALLLCLCLDFSAAAAGRWYYDGEAGKWRYVTSRAPETDIAEAQQPDCLKGQWLQDPEDRHWYYLDRDGWMLTGLQELDGIRYRFRDRPHQGNYLPDPDGHTPPDGRGTGFYSYRANGRPTYGSLEEILGEPDRGSGHSGQRTAGTRENEQKRAKDTAEQKSPSDPAAPQEPLKPVLPKPEKSSASDLPKPDQKASASDIGPREPNEENERRQALEEDDRIHSHIDRDEESHCIAYDLWSRILQHPSDYEDCFENHCTSRLYLTGTAAALPGETENASEDGDLRIPLYVSLLRSPTDSRGSLELVQAYAADALFLPMQVGLENPDDTEPRGNAGGVRESLPWALLNGGTYRWTGNDGAAHSAHYEGFRLCSTEKGSDRQLPLRETAQLGTEGFFAETRVGEQIFDYLDWRDDAFRGDGNIPFLWQSNARFHFLSEQNLFGDAAASLPLPLRKDAYYPAEETWRSSDSYWLGSTPCSGLYVTDIPALLDTLDPELPGSVAALDYAEAGRHYLLYDAGATLDDALFEDTARADRPVGSAEATEPQMLRLRFSLTARG